MIQSLPQNPISEYHLHWGTKPLIMSILEGQSYPNHNLYPSEIDASSVNNAYEEKFKTLLRDTKKIQRSANLYL
jgi:hypothetical protein